MGVGIAVGEGVGEGSGVGEGVAVGEGVDAVCALTETVSTNNKKTNNRDFLIIIESNFLSNDYRGGRILQKSEV